MILKYAIPLKKKNVVHIHTYTPDKEGKGEKKKEKISLISTWLCVRLCAQHFKCKSSFVCMV